MEEYFIDLKKLKMEFYIQSIPSYSKQIFIFGKILLPVHIWNTGAVLYTKDRKNMALNIHKIFGHGVYIDRYLYPK